MMVFSLPWVWSGIFYQLHGGVVKSVITTAVGHVLSPYPLLNSSLLLLPHFFLFFFKVFLQKVCCFVSNKLNLALISYFS